MQHQKQQARGSTRGANEYRPAKGRVSRIIKVQGLAAITGPTANPSSGLRIDWPMSGVVLWVVGSPVGISTNDAYMSGMSSLGFRIQVKGVSEVISNGLSADYIQFMSAFPTAGFRMPLGIRVTDSDAWFVYVRNMHASTTFTPDLAFGLAED